MSQFRIAQSSNRMYNLGRFLEAQEGWPSYNDALQEIRAGQKRSHWIWYIFPQMKGLGYSSYATYYGIESLEEARDYVGHPILGTRLKEITKEVIAHQEDNIVIIMGSGIDAMKFHSSMTLFDVVCPNDVFHEALSIFIEGEHDKSTLKLLGLK